MIRIEDIAENQILFYDLETDHQYAPYCKINLIGVKYGFEGEYIEVSKPGVEQDRFRSALLNPDILKVGFNSSNFDDIILERHGFPICEEGRHDGYLMMKAIEPRLPSYSLKFINFWYLGDPHWSEMELHKYMQRTGLPMFECPKKYVKPYLAHDLEQHKNVFCLAWEKVQQQPHWGAYQLDLSQGPIVKEMSTTGGLFIDRESCREKIAILQSEKIQYENSAFIMSDGDVTNPNSSKQLGIYLDAKGFELGLSANGDFAVKKADLVDIREHDPVAECAFNVRKINGNLKYFENYLRAVNHATFNPKSWIPTSFSISNARTRRYTSSSLYGLNFQNPNEEAKTVQTIPSGWLGWWADSTQVENVVHIYESRDILRRRAYEADPDWSEYVWLCNRILGTNKTKEELDSIQSEQIPNWTVYKQYKTVKLALNFGMGVRKFCSTTGVSQTVGQSTFDTIHDACPAIRGLQNDVAKRLAKHGYVQDVFGHIYADSVRRAYRAVAYLIQGCGTGSLPKAQMAENFRTIHQFDKKDFVGGRMSTTTHDENSGRLNLDLGFNNIIKILREVCFNMTDRFSPKFDNIPLRVKLYLSKTIAANHIEVDICNIAKLKKIIKGEPCGKCKASGKTSDKRTCPSCSGDGYILSNSQTTRLPRSLSGATR